MGASEKRKIKDPLLGVCINQLKITKRIGRGGFGAVYHAQHTQTGASFAIKVLNMYAAEDPEIIERFKREARAIAHLDHPNVVKVSDFGFLEDHGYFIVMEYLDGFSLQVALKSRQDFSLHRINNITHQLCSALHYIHGLGITHRDLKPGNIFIVQDAHGHEHVKLLDFGIAAISDDNSITKTGACIGSPTYMSPEQAEGQTKGVDGRADLYALGVLLYQLFTGSPPFKGDSFAALIRQHILTPPPKLSDVVPEGDWFAPLEDLLLRLLSKEPSGRPDSALNFIQDFQNVIKYQSELTTRIAHQQGQHKTSGAYSPLPSQGTPGPALPTPATPYHLTTATPIPSQQLVDWTQDTPTTLSQSQSNSHQLSQPQGQMATLDNFLPSTLPQGNGGVSLPFPSLGTVNQNFVATADMDASTPSQSGHFGQFATTPETPSSPEADTKDKSPAFWKIFLSTLSITLLLSLVGWWAVSPGGASNDSEAKPPSMELNTKSKSPKRKRLPAISRSIPALPKVRTRTVAASAQLLLESTPSKAKVWSNGKIIGKTPHILIGKVGQSYQLELRHQGYKSQKVSGTFSPDSTESKRHLDLVKIKIRKRPRRYRPRKRRIRSRTSRRRPPPRRANNPFVIDDPI